MRVPCPVFAVHRFGSHYSVIALRSAGGAANVHALRCYEEGIIHDLASADRASVEALGFPAEKGGIVTWGRGADKGFSG